MKLFVVAGAVFGLVAITQLNNGLTMFAGLVAFVAGLRWIARSDVAPQDRIARKGGAR